MKRVLTALVLVPLVWALLRHAPVWMFQAAVAIAMIVALLEAFGIFRALGARPVVLPGLVMSAAVAATFVDALPFTVSLAMPLSLGTVVVLLAVMAFRSAPDEMLAAAQATLFPVLFVGLTLAHLIGLRELGGGELGGELVLLLLLCVALGDTAAYYVGSAIGKRRIAPVLSPKKTLEGAAAAVVASVAAAFVVRAWLWPGLEWEHALILGILLGVAGMFGDLSESLFKRAAGVKDASALLPGHGGVLDRVDGFLFASPVLYYYYEYFLVGLS